MPADNRMLLVAVAPQWVIRAVEEQFGQQIRKTGTMWTGDDLKDAEFVGEDEDVTITVRVKAKDKR